MKKIPELSYRELKVVVDCLEEYREEYKDYDQEHNLYAYPAPDKYIYRLFRITSNIPCDLFSPRLVLHLVDALIDADMVYWEERNS